MKDMQWLYACWFTCRYQTCVSFSNGKIQGVSFVFSPLSAFVYLAVFDVSLCIWSSVSAFCFFDPLLVQVYFVVGILSVVACLFLSALST